MGYLFHAIKIPKVITVAFFLNLISHAHYLLLGALTHLRLYKRPPPPPESPDSASSSANSYILILDSSSPSLVPIPVAVVTAAIKSRVPITEYQELRRRRRGGGDLAEAEEEKRCSICLEGIEGKHEIRELCNCLHLFHRECLDTWIDEGQVSCPLCRSMLLPPRVNLLRCNNQIIHSS